MVYFWIYNLTLQEKTDRHYIKDLEKKLSIQSQYAIKYMYKDVSLINYYCKVVYTKLN